MKKLISFVALTFVLGACASKPAAPNPMLEKYPQCYHINPKIVNKCIEKNVAGENTTALDLENNAFPGQYK